MTRSIQSVNIIAVDWGKLHHKRAAYISQIPERRISKLPLDGSLSHLLKIASTLNGPVLIGIDAAIGFPASAWERLQEKQANPPATFIDFLFGRTVPPRFFDPISVPKDWIPARPFIRPPSGKWSLNAFNTASADGLFRKVDKQLNAQPIFVTSGIPGTVGSGTLALWQELAALEFAARPRIWPFHGSVDELMASDQPIVAEIYPKACYGIALAESLPAPLLSIAKTKVPARREALEALQHSHWLAAARIEVHDWAAAQKSDDDFDALLSAAALTRLFLEHVPFDSADSVDAVAEGGVLGAASVTHQAKLGTDPYPKKAIPSKPSAEPVAKRYPCPIPGCNFVFKNSRGGWDAHVGSYTRHPDWHPGAIKASERKALFLTEFALWFEP